MLIYRNNVLLYWKYIKNGEMFVKTFLFYRYNYGFSFELIKGKHYLSTRTVFKDVIAAQKEIIANLDNILK